MMTFSTKAKMLTITRYTVLVIVSIIMLYPLIWMVAGMWRPNHEAFIPGLFPTNAVNAGESIRNAWTTARGTNLLFYFWNTLRFLLPRVIGQVVSCVLTAYAITRFQFKGKKIVFTLVIATLLMPEVIFRIPLFRMYAGVSPILGRFMDFNLINTPFPLWLEHAFATGSFFVFMLVQFMRGIPKELDEAAKIDGCNSFQTLTLVLLPVMKPAIITVALLTFMWGMNDFIGPLIYLRASGDWVLQQALRQAMDPTGYELIWSNLFAMSVLALVPAITVFFAAQRYFIDGIASTGSKE